MTNSLLRSTTTKPLVLGAGGVLALVLLMGAATKINLTYQVTGLLPAASVPALTGDVTSTAGTVATSVKQISSTHIEVLSSSSGLATGGTIALGTSAISLVAPTAAVTGVIITSGTAAGQVLSVLNNSAFSITMAANTTSHVADGTSDVIAANTSREYVWSGTYWFRKG